MKGDFDPDARPGFGAGNTSMSEFYCHYILVMVLSNGMKELTVPIDQAGRIVLPKQVRQELAIKSGDLFRITTNGSVVSLTPTKTSSGFVRKGKALVFSTSGDELLHNEQVVDVLEEARALTLRGAEEHLAARKKGK
jgi:AbrB family looped-hinge helix DNA binding protein